MLLYVAGPYRGDIDRNIKQAREIAIKLWEEGHAVICPHLNTAHFEQDCSAPEEAYLAGDLLIMARCDGLVLTPDWFDSAGARQEASVAEETGLPQWVWPSRPERGNLW